MKLKKILLGALPALLLTACSNDNVPENREPNIETGDGKYMAVSIKLPTIPSTRAVNDDFYDGTANEYKVFNGCLVIFKGTNEATATFGAAYDLQALNPTEDADKDNITTSFLKSVQLNNLTYQESENLYAFVMLNYKSIAEVKESNGLQIIGQAYPLTKGTTKFAEAFLQTTSNSFYAGSGTGAYRFFMCNAPLANKPGGTTNPSSPTITTLVLLDKTKIKPSKTEAEENVAGSVNVERGVAKASLKWEQTGFDSSSKVATTDKKAISFSFIGWALDVEEKTSYIMRNVTNADWWSYKNSNLSPDNYRFVGSNKIGTTTIQPEQNLYRTYWCIDPHYSTDLDYTPIATPTKEGIYLSKENPLYCYENTFDIANQNYKNTTRAVFQVTLKFDDVDEGTTFYVLDKNESQIYTDLTAVESYPRNTIIGSQLVLETLREALKPGQTLTTEQITYLLNITFNRNAATGIRSVSSVSFKEINTLASEYKEKFTKQPTFEGKDNTLAALISDANSYVIEEYENGNSYYDLRFMHFAGTGDADLAPLPSTFNDSEISDTQAAYGTNPANYLGRYGMVRNNWYDIEVGKVVKLGSPVIPDANVETSDDNNVKEKHLAFKINVLSWAKRTQKVDF